MNAIFLPTDTSVNKFSRFLEVCQSLIDNKEKVLIFTCKADLTSCKINPDLTKSICVNCQGKVKHGLSLLKGNFKSTSVNHLDVSIEDCHNEARKYVFNSKKELKELSYKGFNIGMGVVSTLISMKKLTDIMNQFSDEYIRSKIANSIYVYECLTRHISELEITTIYIHNGRHELQNVAIQAALYHKIDYYTLEANYNQFRRYKVLKNTTNHDLLGRTKRINLIWERSDLSKEKKLKISRQFFTSRLEKHDFQHRKNFLINQEKGRLPDNWNTRKKNIVLFNTSPFEKEAVVTKGLRKLYDSDLDFLTKILDEFQHKLDYHFFLRIHPNLVNNDRKEFHEYYKLSEQFRNFSIINPEDKVDSYELARKSTIVLVSMSTIGIESSYMQRPVISYAHTNYEGLDAVYEPKNHEELLNLLKKEALPAKPMIGVMKYGFFMDQDGIEFKYIKWDNKEPKFQDRYIDRVPIRSQSLMSKLKRTFKRFMKGLATF